MAPPSVHLPEDILLQIFSSLDAPDLVRSGSVCSSWRAAYTSLLSLGGRHKQRQTTPCLLYTAKSSGERAAGLYSLAENRAYEVPLPDPPIRSRLLIGAAHGWLITADERSELHLVNPVTGDQITLPSVATMEHLTPIHGDDGAVREYRYFPWSDEEDEDDAWIVGVRELRSFFFHKAFLSSDPATGDFVAVLLHSAESQLSYARGGDDRWTPVPSTHLNFEDCVFKDELMYALTKSGQIFAFDFSGPAVKQSVIREVTDHRTPRTIYIVEAPCGDLLQVWKGKYLHDLNFRSRKFRLEVEDDSEPGLYALEDDEDFSDPDCYPPLPGTRFFSYVFEVYRVDLAAQELVKLESLGEDVLFLGPNQSLCLSSEEYPQLKRNHVYFTDDCERMAYGHKRRSGKMGVFNLGDDSTKMIVSPRVWSNWPPPLWITPNLRRMNPALHN